MTLVTSKQALLEMFVDRAAGESTQYNRLVTRETDGGNVALIAYGWLKIAEYDEERGTVTVFGGHDAIESKTVSRYLNDVVSVAQDRGRDLILSGESPTVDTPNDGVTYVNEYISFSSNESAVERNARNDVIQSLAEVA